MDTLTLTGLKIAILIANGFEEVEMTKPKKALENAGAHVEIISPEKSKVIAWNGHKKKWGSKYTVNVPLEKANPDNYHALLLPGGVMNPDELRTIPAAVTFVKTFVDAKKPIAVICHGPWTLINAHGVKGRKITSWPSLEADLKNAGATWLDQEVIVDGNMVSSRKPEDIPAFNKAMIDLFAKQAKTNTLSQTKE